MNPGMHDPLSGRRRALLMLGATWLSMLPHRQSGGADAQPGRRPACVLTPQQAEGPYFVDERLDRADIRSDPGDGAVTPGLPLALTLRVLAVDGARCSPLRGATVDLWHCDAAGVYSDVADPGFDTTGKKFLRGYQTTGDDGAVRFVTIYPGWYPGRTVHIHFKVRTKDASRRNIELTSQLYFDDALTGRVHAQPPYARHGKRTQKNETDALFRRGGRDLMLAPVADGPGLAAAFDIGMRVA